MSGGQTVVEIVVKEIVETVTGMDVKAGIKMKVEELKNHIHNELFGERFPTAPPIMEWTEKRKQEVMQHSIKIMIRHGQSEEYIGRMLTDKFFLTEDQAREVVKKYFKHEEEIKEVK